MQIVIDIPEEMINLIKDKSVACLNIVHYGQVLDAIYNGTPLPKGHADGMNIQPSRKFIEDIENEIKTEMQDYDGEEDEFSMGIRCGLRKAIGFIGKYIGGVE